jgi:hypothetical protein
MFFNAHTYYSIKRNGGAVEPTRIVGALLADSAITGVVSWTDLHDETTIQAFMAQLGKDEAHLESGLMDHYKLDLRSHESYEGREGYAFSHQTPQLRELVMKACGFDSPEQARGVAHNFIESGVDINLLRHNSSIQKEVRKALSAADIESISRDMANFFKADQTDTKTKLTAYSDLIVKHDLEGLDGWVALWADITSLLLKKDANEHATRAALLLAAELTAKDYQQIIAT